MKKRILSLLLVLILLVTVSVFAVEADETETPIAFENATTNDDGTLRFYCEACETNRNWSQASANSSGTLELEAHSYVPEGETLTTTTNTVLSGTWCLYLAGNLCHNDPDTGSSARSSMFMLSNSTGNATLNLMGTGTITNTSAYIGGNSGIVRSSSSSGVNTFVMWGGTIDYTGVTANDRGAVLNENSTASTTFRMEGGTINCPNTYSAFNFTNTTGNFIMNGGDIYGAASTSMGAVLRMPAGSTFTMTDGTIHAVECSSLGGSAIYMKGADGQLCTFTMRGGEITGGFVKQTSSNTGGGNLYLEYCTSTISGGTLSDGRAQSAQKNGRGGNIFATGGGSLTISGDAVITGGKAYSSTTTYEGCAYGGNIYATAAVDVTVEGGTISGGIARAFGTGAGEGGNIYALGELTVTDGAISGGTARSDISGNANGGNIYVADLTIEGGTISGGTSQSDDSGRVRGGNIYTMSGGSISISGGAVISGGQAVSDSGNAHGGNILIQSNNTVTIGDCTITGGYTKSTSGEQSHGGNLYTFSGVTMTAGTIESGYTELNGSKSNGGCAGGNVYTAGGTFAMSGGTIQKTISGRTSYYGGNVYVGGTNFNLSGTGAILNGNATRGANVYVASGKNLNVSGGRIDNGNATWGGNVYNVGTMTLSGGVISNGQASTYAPNVLVKNDAEGAGKLNIASGYEGKDSNNDVFNLRVYFEGDVLTGTVISADKTQAEATDGYTNGAKVLATISGEEYPVVGNADGNLVLAGAVTYDLTASGSKSLQKMYLTAQLAVDAVDDGSQFVQLRLPDQEFTLNKSTIVDFNGQDATVNNTINEGVSLLIGMDSKTDSYVDEGAAKVTFKSGYSLNHIATLTKGDGENAVTGTRKYLALKNSGDDAGTYSFHRYILSMDKAGLRTSDNEGILGPGIIYSGVFRGDEAVAKAVTEYGVEFNINGIKKPYPYTEGFQSTVRNEGKLLALHGMMNQTYGETTVTGKAYMVVNGEPVYCLEPASNNLKALVEEQVALYNEGDKLTSTVAGYIEAMVAKFGKAMSDLGWDVGLDG